MTRNGFFSVCMNEKLFLSEINIFVDCSSY